MLYYLLFWTILDFICHFYITFGTNLLTGGPAQNCCFLPFAVFWRNRISNGVQTEWNLRERDFLTKYDPWDLDPTPRHQRGGHKGGGAPPRARPLPCGPPIAPPMYSFLLYIPTYPRQIKYGAKKPNSTAATFCIREIPSWGLFRSSVGGGIYHRGLLHQHHSLSDEVWVVYLRPSGP